MGGRVRAEVYTKVVAHKRATAAEQGLACEQVNWPVDVLVGSYIASCYYDPSVPVQVAEQTLVLLGAPLRVMPEVARPVD